MVFQLINHKNNTTQGFTNVAMLKHTVESITGSRDVANEIYEWATTPCFGSTRYDHDDFEIIIISGDE